MIYGTCQWNVAKLWQLLFVEKTNNAWIQLFRYTFVGGTAFILDFSTLYILTECAHFHYLISAALAFCIGLTFNYICSVCWVFSNRNIQDRRLELLLFGIIGLIGLGLNELIMWILTDFLEFHYLISKMVSTVIIYFCNFALRKWLLFR